jgi:deoxyribodipyrimidine photolyase-related protein
MKLRLILGDQLSLSISSLSDASKDDLILMCEVRQEATYVKHHKKKIAFVFSAMRHFASDLKDQGFNLRYVTYDDPQTAGGWFRCSRNLQGCY